MYTNFMRCMKEKHLMCVNNYFYVIFTSYGNVCIAIKHLFHVCRHQRETKITKTRMQIHIVVQIAHQTM